jgi:hypothetical protein
MRKGTLPSASTHFILLAHPSIGVTWGGGEEGGEMPPSFFLLKNRFLTTELKRGKLINWVEGCSQQRVSVILRAVHSSVYLLY